MQVETKYLRLCQPAALGEHIDGWKVYWVGGWGRDRLFFYVMVARGEEQYPKTPFYGVVNHVTLGVHSDDGVVTLNVGGRSCDNIEKEHRWREYEKARMVAR